MLQATEAIKLLLGNETSLSGALLLYDAQSMTMDTLRFEADSSRPQVVDLSQAASMLNDDAWCMTEQIQSDTPQEQKSERTTADMMFNHLSIAEFMERRRNGWAPFILDVRSDAEYAEVRVSVCDLQVPHSTIHGALNSIPQNTDIVIHCKSGMRSQLAAIELIKSGYSAQHLYNLEGGIMAWHAAAPDEVVR